MSTPMNGEDPKCKHKHLAEHIERALSDGGGMVVDVACADCGCTGSLRIEPNDVNWDEDDEA